MESKAPAFAATLKILSKQTVTVSDGDRSGAGGITQTAETQGPGLL